MRFFLAFASMGYTISALRIIDQFFSAQYDPFSILLSTRGIAQSGSAPALGAGCRGFKSLYPEKKRRDPDF